MVIRCKTHAKDFLHEKIRNELKQYKYVFNPSFVILDKYEYWAFRCYSEEKNEILCIIYSVNNVTGQLKIIELNPLFKNRYNVRPADPKLLILNKKVYCTLNSGYVDTGENNIYLFRVDTETLNLKKCVIYNRNRIEKNWAFFNIGGKIKMLYSISPICKIYLYEKEDNENIYFKLEKELTNNLPEYSIGTQLQISGDYGYFISHKKIQRKGKRLYLGIPLKINLKTLQISVMSSKMIHSFRSLFGNKFKFNKKLISCTYFSGLQINFDFGESKITYGINDINWGSLTIKTNKLWQ